MKALSAALELLMIRRLKIDLPELEMPSIEEIDIFLPISPAHERAIYKAALLRLDGDVLQGFVEGDENSTVMDQQAM